MQSTNITPPQTGTHVFGSDGEEIGTISDVQPGYFKVKRGTFFHKEVYLPLTSITGTALGGEGVTVNLTRDEAESGDWSQPPADDAGSDDLTTRP
jgi:PRC-barrel domain